MKVFLNNELAKAAQTCSRVVEELNSLLVSNIRKYGWSDDGSLYIGGSLARGELSSGSDVDLILFKSTASRKGKYSPSSVSTFRTAAMATNALNRKVSVIPVSECAGFAVRYAPMAFRSGILKGKPVGLENYFLPEYFEGPDGEARYERITSNLVGLASLAALDKDCVRNGYNGYRYSVLASALAEVRGTAEQKEDAEKARKLLFVYTIAGDRVNGHCGLDGANAIIDSMSEEERSEGGVNLLDSVDSARSIVQRLLTELCQAR